MFPACVVTRAQSRKLGDLVNLGDSVFEYAPVSKESEAPIKAARVESTHLGDVLLSATTSNVVEAQKGDSSLATCFRSVVSLEESKASKRAYYVDNGVLMHKWKVHDIDGDWSTVSQVVLPTLYRQQVLSVAHDPAWSGHLGISKTFDRILQHFFWPGLKSDVVEYCKTCHMCQIMGKPNQSVPRAPLCPIPVVGEPFDRIIVDCVGPLPKTGSGNQFLLTIMCCATRYPEAVPLRNITAKTVTKALIKFFTTFGLPKEIQTDQGSNFMSKLLSRVA